MRASPSHSEERVTGNKEKQEDEDRQNRGE